ncbi:MAG TPA: sigma-70 family RNA polymerase sigma factor [Gaiellaceae bacterium]|nr:sigma-70 family RNA polymerase sigma factor [Gaiellaceae bacterium]
MQASSDADLVAACLAGESSAWDELVERFSRYVFAIATQAFRLPAHEAEDVFQEVFLRVYDRLNTLREPSALRPWIAQLTRRECIDRVRQGARETPVEELPEEVESELDRLEEAFDVRLELSTLSPECQDVLDRFFCRDESYRTIGAALDLPAGTIASRISRCLGRLRERLEGRNPVAAASSERRDR